MGYVVLTCATCCRGGPAKAPPGQGGAPIGCPTWDGIQGRSWRSLHVHAVGYFGRDFAPPAAVLVGPLLPDDSVRQGGMRVLELAGCPAVAPDVARTRRCGSGRERETAREEVLLGGLLWSSRALPSHSYGELGYRCDITQDLFACGKCGVLEVGTPSAALTPRARQTRATNSSRTAPAHNRQGSPLQRP